MFYFNEVYRFFFSKWNSFTPKRTIFRNLSQQMVPMLLKNILCPWFHPKRMTSLNKKIPLEGRDSKHY